VALTHVSAVAAEFGDPPFGGSEKKSTDGINVCVLRRESSHVLAPSNSPATLLRVLQVGRHVGASSPGAIRKVLGYKRKRLGGGP
jgi:hypothetical protein